MLPGCLDEVEPMEVNIRAFPDDSGVAVFQGKADLSQVVRWGERPFPQPVEISGRVVRRGDAAQANGEDLTRVEYRASYTLCGACSRCLAPVEQPEQADFAHVVVERLEEDAPEDWAEAPGGRLDLNALAAADLLLSLESTLLCREDCAGICPVCGANQNLAPCDCAGNNPIDPRFAALKDLLTD